MRAVGYDAAAAVADIIDNSVTAGARRVQIWFDPGYPKAVAILDDGQGMTPDELLTAMRHGSRSPAEARAVNDLGRFGLGMKTASMSQCRRLTVVTRRDGVNSGMVWDLDEVARSCDWLVGALDDDEIIRVPYATLLLAQPTGTLVVWEKLDRLAADDPGTGAVLSDRMCAVADHLSLVFHRYLSDRLALCIEVNGGALEPADPFLEDSGAIRGPEETLDIDGHKVRLQAYTLPHISRLTRSQIEKAGGEQGLRRQQGFYVYRQRRLIIWGTWFRLFRQEELTKLTRVRVDVPNALDHLWSLDIKKSTASPPAAISARLRTLVPTMTEPSRTVHRWRGRTTGPGPIKPMWNRIDDRDGVRYDINENHPIVIAFRRELDDGISREFNNLLRAISSSLPIEALYNDRANDQLGHRRDEEHDPELLGHLEELARQMLANFADVPMERQQLLNALPNIEPFALHPRIAVKIQRRLT